MKNYFLTAESVTPGHPDKIADQIADAILDEILKQDKFARVACEVFVSKGYVIVGGEITTKGWVNINNLVRSVIREIGYDNPEYLTLPGELGKPLIKNKGREIKEVRLALLVQKQKN
jgi:S-adenosylmethionine synthetase